MKKKILAAAVATALLFAGSAQADEEKFDIQRFDVVGNTLLPKDQVDSLVAPYMGKGRVYGDIQKALEALEHAYREAGYSTIQVFVPEQELTSGAVKLQVTEAGIGKVKVSGNQYFTVDNIRASLPQLKEGTAPNTRKLSENVQLANDNPAKQVELTLGIGEAEGTVDAKVSVNDQKPQRFYLTADDTGTGATGHIRTGIAYQNANLAGGDEVLTAAYTTSPDAPSGVKVDIYSLAFRKPFYSLGDSLDLIYGDSNVNTPSAQSTGFGLTGKGRVLAARWNHYFARSGEYSSRLIFGLDWKKFNTTCTLGSAAGPTPTTLQACVPHTTRPVSATYVGQWQGTAYAADFNAGLYYNLPTGSKFTVNTTVNPSSLPSLNGTKDYYSFIANRKVDDNFTVLRAGGSYAHVLGNWQIRAAANGQVVNNGLVPGEQFGLAGSNAVRGFAERAVATDSGVFVNLEAYSPDFAGTVHAPGLLRGVLFYDQGNGWNHGAKPPYVVYTNARIASWGFGLRYGYDKNVAFRADIAQVIDHGPVFGVEDHSWRGHFSLSVGF